MSFIYFIYFCLGATPGFLQGLFLSVYSGVMLGGIQRIIDGIRDLNESWARAKQMPYILL